MITQVNMYEQNPVKMGMEKKKSTRFVSKGPAFKSEAPGWKHGGASECTATVMLMKESQAVNGGSL